MWVVILKKEWRMHDRQHNLPKNQGDRSICVDIVARYTQTRSKSLHRNFAVKVTNETDKLI